MCKFFVCSYCNKITTGILLGSLVVMGCRGQLDPNYANSDVKVSQVPHTVVKEQLIGNCWAYAITGWAESLHLRATNETINLSESYLTYWQTYEKLLGSREDFTSFETSAYWEDAKQIIRTYGVMKQADFPVPSGDEAEAEEIIGRSLAKGGELYESRNRTKDKILAVLDSAFRVRMSVHRHKAIQAKDFVIGTTKTPRQPRTLLQAVSDPSLMWKFYSYRYVLGRKQPTSSDLKARKQLLRRVMKAMNEGYPVMMGTMLDFKAWNQMNNSFVGAKLKGKPGEQGGHMAALSDYAVRDAPDGKGGTMDIGFGNVTSQMKALAVQGTLTHLVAKNSWGAAGVFAPKIKSGHTVFDMEYLDKSWDWKNPNGKTDRYTTLSEFILPPAMGE